MIDVFSLNLTGERFLDNRIIEAGSAVLMVHGVFAINLIHGVHNGVDCLILGTAVNSNIACIVGLGHGLAGLQILIPRPSCRNFTQTSFVPHGLVDGNIERTAASGERVDFAVIGVAVGAPVFGQVDVIRCKVVGQVHIQTVLPTLERIVQLEAPQNVDLAGHQRSVDGGITIGVVAVGGQFNRDVRISLVEFCNQIVHALLTFEGNPEANGTGN